MDTIAFWLVWGSALALFYTYAGFGFLVAFWGGLRRRRVHAADVTPSISLIIAAYNEEDVIEEKLRNCLLLDYPSNELEIILASDGSDDRTEFIACNYAGDRVHLLPLPRRGKIHALADAVQRARGEILVFTDANTLLHPSSLHKLARNFADPDVGGVCGNQVHLAHPSSDSSEGGEKLYWGYDKWLKVMETRTGSIVSADGAIYAIRRSLFRKPEISSVTDDFAISTAVVEQGQRLVFEPEALAYEAATGAALREFRRKVRLMNRGMRGVVLRRRLLNPFRFGFYSLILFSHKVVRRLAPFFLITLLSGSLLLAGQPFYREIALLQAGFYALAFLGWCLKARSLGRMKFLALPFFYCMANAAALVALIKLVRGERIEQWQPQRHALKA